MYCMSYDIPDEWRIAKVISLFKKGKSNDTNNYKGIGLLNVVFTKYVAKVINERSIKDNLPIVDKILLQKQASVKEGPVYAMFLF